MKVCVCVCVDIKYKLLNLNLKKKLFLSKRALLRVYNPPD